MDERLKAIINTKEPKGNWVHGVGAWGSPDWPERYGIHPREPVRPTEFWSIEYNVSGAVPEHVLLGRPDQRLCARLGDGCNERRRTTDARARHQILLADVAPLREGTGNYEIAAYESLAPAG